MCSLKKNAVIFKVGTDIEDPIVVIQQKMFTKEEPDSCVPILGIYDGTHYQSVFPASNKDEQLTEDQNFRGISKLSLRIKQTIKNMD